MAHLKGNPSEEAKRRKEERLREKREKRRREQIEKHNSWKNESKKKSAKSLSNKRTAIKQKPKKSKQYKGVQMPEHTAVYMKFFGYGTNDFIKSELTGSKCKDIHHIRSRGAGGTKREEDIKNLMSLTRLEHDYFGDKKHFLEFLDYAHEQFLQTGLPLIEVDPHNGYLIQFLKTLK